MFKRALSLVSYRRFEGDITYWRLASGIEVDFILGNMRLAVEAKSRSNISSHHLRGLRSLIEDHPEVGRRVLVCGESKARTTEDGIEILPVETFVRRLWDGDLV